MKNKDIISCGIKYCIRIIFAAITGYLLVSSFLYTAVTDSVEKTVIRQDGMVLNIVALAIVAGIVILFNTNKKLKGFIVGINKNDKKYKIILWIVLGIIFIEAIAFFLLLSKEPAADQSMVCTTAEQWVLGDYVSYNPSCYIDRYPNQLGIVSLMYILIKVFGSKYQAVFQLLNVLSIVITYKSMADIARMEKLSNVSCIASAVSGILFLPMIFYSTFRYGNILGLALSVLAFKYLCKYIKTDRWYYLIITVIAQFAAACIKNNYLIFVIALIVYIVLYIIKKYDVKLLITAIILMVMLVFTTSVCGLIAQGITGQKAPKGMTSLAWVAMGLHDNEALADGWYDGFTVESYFKAECDREVQKEIVKDNIKARIEEFKKDPAMALSFFNSKNESQWNNADFQSTCINEQMVSKTELGEKLTGILSENRNIYIGYCNILHFIILLMAAIYIVTDRRKSDVTLYYALCITGGFVFHCFWEAKGQYTLTYFVLLLGMLPWAVNRLTGLNKKRGGKNIG